MNPRSFKLLGLIGGLLMTGAALFAQGPHPGFGPGMDHPFEGKMGRHLGLSDTQQAQVKAILERHKAAIKAKMDAAQTAQKAMHEAMKNSATDANTLKALHQKASDARFEVMQEHRAVHQEILPLLTPEQKAKLEAHREKGGFPGGRGRGPGRGEGRGEGHGFGRPDGPPKP